MKRLILTAAISLIFSALLPACAVEVDFTHGVQVGSSAMELVQRAVIADAEDDDEFAQLVAVVTAVDIEHAYRKEESASSRREPSKQEPSKLTPPPKAAFPAHLLERDLSSLRQGERGWATCWTLIVSDHLYVHTKATVDAEPMGTVQLLVWREPQGWVVDIGRCVAAGHLWDVIEVEETFLSIERVVRIEGVGAAQ